MLHSHGFHELTTFMSWTFLHPAFPEEEYYEEEGTAGGSDAAYNYQEEIYTALNTLSLHDAFRSYGVIGFIK